MADRCPRCRQEIKAEHGACLPPKKSEIWDAIVAARISPVPLETLARVVYPDDDSEIGKHKIRVHVAQINDLLASTDYRIASECGAYRIVRPKKRAA